MKRESIEVHLLRKKIEETFGRQLIASADFIELSQSISDKCGERLSEATLKRIWSYVKGYDHVRYYTLSVLARYAGYSDWFAFCEKCPATERTESDEILGTCIRSSELEVGTKIKLTWFPDRVCTIEYKGDNIFFVLDSQSSKLMKGNLFSCMFFIEGEPLYIDRLEQEGKPVAAYVAGKNGGLFSVEILQNS